MKLCPADVVIPNDLFSYLSLKRNITTENYTQHTVFINLVNLEFWHCITSHCAYLYTLMPVQKFSGMVDCIYR